MINLNNFTKLFSNNYLFKSSGLLAISQGISAIVNFAILSLYTKYLPASEFGKISLLWMIVIIISIIIDSGMNTSFSIKFYKENTRNNAKNIFSIFIYYIVILFGFYITFLICPDLFNKLINIETSNNINTTFILVLFMLFGNFYTNILLVAKKPKQYFYIRLIFNISLLLLSSFYIFILRSDYTSYFKAYSISYFIISLLGLRYLYRNYKFNIKYSFSLFRIKNLLQLGLPLVPNALLIMLLTWADRYIINSYSGIAVVGIYSVGYRFSEIIDRFFVGPFGKALSPILFQQYAESLDIYKKSLNNIFKYYWLIMLTVIILYFIILKEMYVALIGEEYLNGYNIIPIILVGIMFQGIANFLGATIVMKEKTNRMFLFTSISVLINIGLNFILIPKFGMYGAAIATLLSYIVQFIFIYTYTQKLVKINYDYFFVGKSVILSLTFLIGIISVSYLNINPFQLILIKITMSSIFIYIVYKFLEIKNITRLLIKDLN